MRKLVFTLVAILISLNSLPQTLAEKLGYKSTDRLLIIHCDDIGLDQSNNLAATEGQAKGIMTSGSVIVPGPRFDEAARLIKENPKLDMGIQITLTSEIKELRWGSIAPAEKIKKLLAPDGFMRKSVEELYHNSTPQEAYYEGKAQIKKAIAAGIKPTHLNSHLDALQLMVPYADVYLQLAVEFNLPVRLASKKTLEDLGLANIRQRLAEKGILFPDYLIYDELENYPGSDAKTFWSGIIKNLQPGVTELYIHAAKPNPEMKKIFNDLEIRNAEYSLFATDEDFAQWLKGENIILIGYKALFDLQQKNIH